MRARRVSVRLGVEILGEPRKSPTSPPTTAIYNAFPSASPTFTSSELASSTTIDCRPIAGLIPTRLDRSSA